MKKLFFTLPALFAATSLLAQTSNTAATWHAQTLLSALGNTLIFAAVGIFAAILGFKIFDWCTPGDLQKEIIEHKNVAAAIVAAAAILGVSIIVAASMLG
jgi:uncharacterized membrane protein YjfL (UPF0719 family)